MRAELAVFAIVGLPLAAPAQAVWSRLYLPRSPPGRFDALVTCRESTGDVVLLFGQPDTGGGVSPASHDRQLRSVGRAHRWRRERGTMSCRSAEECQRPRCCP